MANGHGWVGDFIHRTELARPVVCLCARLKVNSTHLVLLYSEGGQTDDGCSMLCLVDEKVWVLAL